MAEKILAHLVAGYPSERASFMIAKALLSGGATALEIQFPYSDPMADGPAIQEACQVSLDAGFTVHSGFGLVKSVKLMGGAAPVFIMSYAGLVISMGVDQFCAAAKDAGASGLIVPDLAPGYDEGLYRAGRSFGLAIIPVLIPSVSPGRLTEILLEETEWVYVALRAGITGEETSIDAGAVRFLDGLRKRGIMVMAGFGIKSAGQVRSVASHCDLVVIGSEIVRTIVGARSAGNDLTIAVTRKISELSGS